MLNVAQLRAALIVDPTRAEQLETADYLIQAYLQNPDRFRMPKAQKHLTPLLEDFALDLEGWLEFVSGIQAAFPRRSDASMAIAPLKLKVHTRHDAHIRRARQNQAAAACEAEYGPFASAIEKEHYRADCVVLWRLGRNTMLKQMQKASTTGKITEAEKAAACDRYWKTIAVSILAGNIPSVETMPEALRKAKELNATVNASGLRIRSGDGSLLLQRRDNHRKPPAVPHGNGMRYLEG